MPFRAFQTPRAGPGKASGATLVEIILLLVVIALVAVPLMTFFKGSRIASFPVFPWEPPHPTTWVRIPDEFKLNGASQRTLGELAKRLEAGLNQCGYNEKGYYDVPGGFAVVCKVEQLDRNWAPQPEPDRWAEGTGPLRRFSLLAYLERLFLAHPGRYRLLVFVFTDAPFSFKAETLSKQDGRKLLFGGSTGLPDDVAARRTSPNTQCVALIYEFKKDGEQDEAQFVAAETVGAKIQLERNGLLESFRKI